MLFIYLTDTIQDRAFNLVAHAYSSINAEEFSQIVGMPLTQAIDGKCVVRLTCT